MSRKKADSDNPEWTDEDFAGATKFPAGKRLTDVVRTLSRRGRPPLAAPKEAIKLRIDTDVLQAYRQTGEGWQSRINADLRKARKLAR